MLAIFVVGVIEFFIAWRSMCGTCHAHQLGSRFLSMHLSAQKHLGAPAWGPLEVELLC